MRAKKTEFEKVFELLGIKMSDFDDESIYDFSPVFKGRLPNGELIVVKKTKKDLRRAIQLAGWTTALFDAGIKIVSPVDLSTNPVSADDGTWIAYPFITGRQYGGSYADIENSASLLAKVHSYNCNQDFDFGKFNWTDFDADFFGDVENDLDTIQRFCKEKKISEGNVFCYRARRYVDDQFQTVRQMELPYVNSCWDFKANNLVFEQCGHPVLIDPDNAGRIPRILDLALALVLFHNELNTAPARPFTPAEWRLFLDKYKQNVEFIDVELEFWTEVLNFVLVDEALWAITDNINDGWEAKAAHQKSFIKALLSFDPDAYHLY